LLFSQQHQDPPSESSFLSLHKTISIAVTPSNPLLPLVQPIFKLKKQPKSKTVENEKENLLVFSYQKIETLEFFSGFSFFKL